MTETERLVLEQYSTPGLRRNQLTREGKKDHLLGLGVPRVRVELVLDKIYGKEGEILPKGDTP